jgi:hypothetical protein
MDPAVRSLSRSKLQDEINDFMSLLDSRAEERIVHDFLSRHSYFFYDLIRSNGFSTLYSKIKLGSDYEVDFAWFDTSSNGPEWSFVELEAPTRRMFTALGYPSQWLIHAIQQVLDWHSWIHDNLDYAKRLMPHVEYPRGYVFIGRRSELTPIKRKRLRRLQYEYRRSVEIHTLDWFVTSARNFQYTVTDHKGGNWEIPSGALGHGDLAKGCPVDAFKWLNSQFADNSKAIFQEYSLEEREQSALLNPDLFNEDRNEIK